ncbi:MAG: hypothetical protein AAF065_11480 [Verrucomicrobiota bacterium]
MTCGSLSTSQNLNRRLDYRPYLLSSDIPPVHLRAGSSRSGFALNVSLTLMAFVLLLLVSITTLVQVETGSAATAQKRFTAEQNALLSVQIALGELQRSMGPDQRVSATADIAGTIDGQALSESIQPENNDTAVSDSDGNLQQKGLVPVQHGTRYWTGVWEDSRLDDGLSKSALERSFYRNTPAPTGTSVEGDSRAVKWLVSYDQNQALPTPQDVSSIYGLDTEGNPLDSDRAVVLVGEGSLGPADETVNGEANVRNFISAPLVEIEEDGARIAWWIGDESVKSLINGAAGYNVGDEASYGALASPRRGWESVDGFRGAGDVSYYPLPSENSALERISSYPQAELLNTALASTGNAPSVIQENFHAATPYSMGVLADPLRGGLRIDLSTALAKNSLDDLSGQFLNGLNANANIVANDVFGNAAIPKGPTWDNLQEFYQLSQEAAEDGDSFELKVKEGDGETTRSISPVVVDMRFLLGMRCVTQDNPRVLDPLTSLKPSRLTTSEPEERSLPYLINPVAKVAITLANPFSVPLVWDENLELEVIGTAMDKTHDELGMNTSLWFTIHRPSNNIKYDAEGQSVDNLDMDEGDWNSPGDSGADTVPFLPSRNDSGVTQPSLFHNTKFTIAPDRLEPGQAKSYTINQNYYREYNTDEFFVELTPVDFTSIQDFRNCLEMQDHSIRDYKAKVARVGEQGRESTCVIELGLAGGGSGERLLYLGEFDWNNIQDHLLQTTYLTGKVGRWAQYALATYDVPLAMSLYRFQMSQPGMNYADNWFGEPAHMGASSSAVRTFMDFNLQGDVFIDAITSLNPPPYVHQTLASEGALGLTDAFKNANDDDNPVGFVFSYETGPAFSSNLIDPIAPWGRNDGNGSYNTVLFDVPGELVSLAQLQHADLSGDLIRTYPDDVPDNRNRRNVGSTGHQAGYAVGNSYHSPFVRRGTNVQLRWDYHKPGFQITNNDLNDIKTNNYHFYRDQSHLLNTALWDSYFFSTYDRDDKTVRNPSMVQIKGVAGADPSEAPEKVAAEFMVNGAFNVNSTSKEAWKALLAGTQHLSHPAEGSDEPEGAFFPRSTRQPNPSVTPASGTGEDSFSGYRRLTEVELDNLAEEIVKQVRIRGPFVSLSHFINRSLILYNETEDGVDAYSHNAQSRSGPLQYAIDKSGININYDFSGSGDNAFEDIIPTEDRVKVVRINSGSTSERYILASDANPVVVDKSNNIGKVPNPGGENDDFWPWAGTGDSGVQHNDRNAKSMASIVAEQNLLVYKSDINSSDGTLDQPTELGYRSTGIPGWLTQADVLQVIGPSLSARSDTFRIRTYGEVRDPISNEVEAKAWCEAIVQRYPDYVDSLDDAETPLDLLTSDINRDMGRRFRVVSLRWLNEDQI